MIQTLIANEVKNTSYSGLEECIPPSPSESFFPEVAYAGENSPSRKNSNANPVDALITAMPDLLKKFHYKNQHNGKSKPTNNQNKKENSNPILETQKPEKIKGSNKPKFQDNFKSKESPHCQKKKVPVKQEDPRFNCSREDHGWRKCKTK